MGSYDHNVQKNIDKKMSQYGMVPSMPRVTTAKPNEECESLEAQNCVRSMEYLQRIVKSMLRQMNVHSHVFGPGEAITIDLQAELKYDDYVVLTKFMNSQYETDKYLYRIDEIMSNFIHVVEHSSSRFEFLENIFRFPGFYSLKFWLILTTSTVIGSLIAMLFIKAFSTRYVHVQLLYGFLIMFILSCVWTFSCMYEDKKAEVMAHNVQQDGLPPKDCDYQNWNGLYSAYYFLRVSVSGYKDQCSDYYKNTMTDPLWKVNPMEAISNSAAYFFFGPLNYIGNKLGGFIAEYFSAAPLYLAPIMLLVLLFIIFLVFFGPFRISTPLLTIEPVWRPIVPALEPSRSQQLHAIQHDRIRNEIMERPDGPIVKSIKNAATDMDGFREYLCDEGSDETEIIGPFPRFNMDLNRKPNDFKSEDTEVASVSVAVNGIVNSRRKADSILLRSSSGHSQSERSLNGCELLGRETNQTLNNDVKAQNGSQDDLAENSTTSLLEDAMKESLHLQ